MLSLSQLPGGMGWDCHAGIPITVTWGLFLHVNNQYALGGTCTAPVEHLSVCIGDVDLGLSFPILNHLSELIMLAIQVLFEPVEAELAEASSQVPSLSTHTTPFTGQTHF